MSSLAIYLTLPPIFLEPAHKVDTARDSHHAILQFRCESRCCFVDKGIRDRRHCGFVQRKQCIGPTKTFVLCQLPSSPIHKPTRTQIHLSSPILAIRVFRRKETNIKTEAK
ncbi:hypothetical protein KCU75_g6, partial [Aureobasidium melanogenum]